MCCRRDLVGLASGLLVLAAWWAAIASGGRSSFTPVAVGFAIAIGLAVVRRWRRRGEAPAVAPTASQEAGSASRRRLLVATLGGATFVVAVALNF